MSRYAKQMLPAIIGLIPAHSAGLVLAVLAVFSFIGCGSQPPATTDAPTDSSSGKKSNVTAGTVDREKDAPRENAVATPANAARAKPPAAPSPEQIAKWAIPEFQPLQLLACFDGFSDSFVQSLAVSPDGKQFVLGGAKLTVWRMPNSTPGIDLLANYKDTESGWQQAIRKGCCASGI
jgi:hypothetical protein